MHQRIKSLYGMKLIATDGPIGPVRDFYFDEATWTIRYLVVETGSWPAKHQGLLATHALAHTPRTASAHLVVNLSRKQVEACPSIEQIKPLTRKPEQAYRRYHGWPAYWQDDDGTETIGVSSVDPIPVPEETGRKMSNPTAKIQQRSTKTITGYNIQAMDGTIGVLHDFTMNSDSWEIQEIVVRTGGWFSPKEILVRCEDIERISRKDHSVFISRTIGNLQRTALDDVELSGVVHR